MVPDLLYLSLDLSQRSSLYKFRLVLLWRWYLTSFFTPCGICFMEMMIMLTSVAYLHGDFWEIWLECKCIFIWKRCLLVSKPGEAALNSIESLIHPIFVSVSTFYLMHREREREKEVYNSCSQNSMKTRSGVIL